MNQLFHFERGNVQNVQQVLSLTFGGKHGSFAITDKTGDILYALAYCSVEKWDENSLVAFFAQYESIQQPFYQVLIAFDQPQNILVPSSVYSTDGTEFLLRMAHGIQVESQVVSELIPGWQVYNAYAVPGEMMKWIRARFPAARSMHQFSLRVKKMNGAGIEGSILVDFSKEDFAMLVAGNNRILLAQSYSYKTPEDIIYYLLSACAQFSLSQDKVLVQLSGLIDKESSLYRELSQYFICLEFREAAWDGGKEYPAHFFTSLNDLAQCAS